MRTTVSPGPPDANGTITVMARSGKAAAAGTAPATSASAAMPDPMVLRGFIVALLVLRCPRQDGLKVVRPCMHDERRTMRNVLSVPQVKPKARPHVPKVRSDRPETVRARRRSWQHHAWGRSREHDTGVGE
jgi:hypothetical protein